MKNEQTKLPVRMNIKNVKKFLHIDHDYDDALINLYILSAEELAIHYLGDKFYDLRNKHPMIKTAMIMHIKYLYEEEWGDELLEKITHIYSSYINKKLY